MSKTKKYAASITESIKSTNSTSPLPQSPSVKQRNQLSRDVAALYELFSTVPTTKQHYNDKGIICCCCDREITNRRDDSVSIMDSEEDRKRKLKDVSSNSKLTSALYYGSKQVRKYMKKVMTRDKVKQGSPCPHKPLWSKPVNSKPSSSSSSMHNFCTLCDQTQDTLRLTLTPSTCRTQDNEYHDIEIKSKKVKKRREGNKGKGELIYF